MLAGRGSPVLFRGDHCFDWIINAESITSQKKAAWKGKRMLKPFSEIVGNSVLFSRQNSQNNFFHETQVSNPTAVFKIKHSNPMRSKDKLNLILFCRGKKDRKILHSLLFAIQSSHYFRAEDSVEWIPASSWQVEVLNLRWCVSGSVCWHFLVWWGQHRSQDCMRSDVTQEALTERPQVICAGLGLNFARIVCRNLVMSPVYFIPMFNYQTSYVGCKVPWAMTWTSICHSFQYHLGISPCSPF